MKTFLRLFQVKNLLILIVKFYQFNISPLLSAKCPFQPSCSSYMIKALNEYGLFQGVVLGSWRILRCNPFNKGYNDPPKYWGAKLNFKPIKRRDC